MFVLIRIQLNQLKTMQTNQLTTMQTKMVPAKKYFCFVGQTTLNNITEIAGKEVDPLFEEAAKLGLQQTGPLEFIYFDATEDKNKPFTLWIALPISHEKPLQNSNYTIHDSGDFKCFAHVHQGDLSDLYSVYDKIFGELFSRGLKPGNQIREVYEVYENLVSEKNITEIQIGII
jgi:predicted transcriptional regulator YdeE